MTNLTIVPELRDLLDLPSETERKMLETDLVASGGPRDELIVWKDGDKEVLVDGHNRYGICQAHKLPFRIRYMPFKDIEAVKEWIINNQLGRRNLSPMRFTYFVGLLYNKTKQDPEKARVATVDGKTTATALSEQFSISERTVRRAGEEAKGVDVIGAVHGLKTVQERLAHIKDKNYTKDDLAVIGGVTDPVIATQVVKEVEAVKADIKKAKEAVTTKAKAKTEGTKKAPASVTQYPVVFSKPDFSGMGFSVANMIKPPMAENSVLYMMVPDEEMAVAMDIIKKWQLKYEGTFIFTDGEGYEGAFSDVRHTFLIVASRGIVTAPKKAAQSLVKSTGSVEEAMIKLIEGYHTSSKRLDLRTARNAAGWDTMKAA